jgi:RNA polymerase sigma-70 factor (ECF subfamily)
MSVADPERRGRHQSDEAATREGDDRQDVELIARWKSGDERAAAELVSRHSRALARFAMSSGMLAADVDEVVQDTFVRAFGAIDGFRGDSSFRTWLFTIERRLLLDRARVAKRRAREAEVREEDSATEFDALDTVVADETQRRVLEAVDRLSPTQRQVFTLRVTEGLSYKEIAEVAGTTEGAARVHYHNALRAVKEMLE